VLILGELEVPSTGIFSDVDDQTVADKDVREAIQVLKKLEDCEWIERQVLPSYLNHSWTDCADHC
jgi:hypothetical protein